jgi:PX domain
MSARSSATMADLFEKNLGSSGTKKEEVKRKQTRILEGTMLTNKNSIVCKISNIQQEVERHVKGFIKTKTDFYMTISSYPFGWKVTRSHEDFVALREYLVRKYPQTLVPGVPHIKPRKEYSKA